jgi:hypothetical protein
MALPKKSVTIIPNLLFTPGNAHAVLTEINAGPIAEHMDGSLSAQLNEQQIAAFRLKAPMHRIVVSEPPAPGVYSAADWEKATTAYQEQLDALASTVSQWQAATSCSTPEEFLAKQSAAALAESRKGQK